VVGQLQARRAGLEEWPAVGCDLPLWTDDYSSLFPLLK
jgi:hypothetical protein